MNAIDRLLEYRNNEEKYLPLIDHETDYFPFRTETNDVNIGWDCGFIGNRPYFLECWATSGITMITVFLSTIGIEDYTVADLEILLIEEGKLYSKKEGYQSPDYIPKTVDDNGNEFFSINIVVGVEDEPARIDGGGQMVPFSALNELNGFSDEDFEDYEDDDDDAINVSALIRDADNGDIDALHQFVSLCYSQDEEEVPEDIKDTFLEFLHRFADEDDIVCLIFLGKLYQNGRFVEQDTQKSIEYYKKAADAGKEYAYECIGEIYYKNSDYETAYKYLIRSEKQTEMACFLLGEMYRMGLYVEENMDKATELYKKAVEQGYELVELPGTYQFFAQERLNGNFGELEE